MIPSLSAIAVLIELLGVVLDPAVVSFVHDSIVICVRVTLVPRTVFVRVVLVCVWTIWTIVQGIWDPVLVLVVVGVANISKRVFVSVGLIRVPHIGAVVASVSKPVSITVLLVEIRNQRTVVPLVENAVVVLVRIALVAESVFVRVFLVQIWQIWAVVARVLHRCPSG